MRQAKQVILVLFAFLFFENAVPQKLAAIAYVSGFDSPIDVKHCGDYRLFVAERGGRIRVIDSAGHLLTAPFLDITSKISSTNSEEGFLGIAFNPQYMANGRFYVYYTSNIDGQLTSVVQEYRVSTADSNLADTSSAITLLTQAQPFSNHNGGNLMFGKDGYLYINLGDGGSGGDPFHNGQNKKTFLAKILRIDVGNSSVAQPYTIPVNNPFYNDTTTGIKKEIWAYGVRNPWRSSIDRLTGDLWIADVGQNAVEEIDYQPANAPGGTNYGWNIMEGKSCYSPAMNCDTTGFAKPIYDYPHPLGNSITGGYVYRSAQSKSLFGTYVFGDYVGKWINGIRQSNGVLADSVSHYITSSQALGNPISFGEDRYGDQYVILNSNTTLYKLEDTSAFRKPKAYISSADMGAGAYLLHGLEGRNLTYQWYKDNVAIPGATSADYRASATGKYNLEVTNTLHLKDTSESFLLGSSINLFSFTAIKITDRLIGLNWTTSAELNIISYTIQRRQGNEISFSDIDSLASKSAVGYSNSELDYAFVDSLTNGYTTLFYRLKIYHADGSITYSDIKFITTDQTINGYVIFPNPGKDHVQVFINEYTHPLLLVLYTIEGKEIKSQAVTQQVTTIDLYLSKGIYFIQVSNNDGSDRVIKKLLVL